MSDEKPAKKSAKKELTIEEQVEKKIREEARLEEIKLFEREKRKEVQDEKNRILVKKAFEGGLTDAPSIGKKISMSENGVRRYAVQLGLQLTVTRAEARRAQADAVRQVQEQAELMKYGAIGPNND